MPQRVFKVGRLVVGFGIARTGCWAITSDRGEQRTIWFGAHSVRSGRDSAFSMIAGPFSVIAGVKRKEPPCNE